MSINLVVALMSVGLVHSVQARPRTECVLVGTVLGHGAPVPTLSIGESVSGGRVLEVYPRIGLALIEPPASMSSTEFRRALEQSGRFSTVSANAAVEPTAMGNDPSLPTQWHLFRTSAPRAWDFSTGVATGPIVAVVDSGVDTTHPDLVPNLAPGYNTMTGISQANGGDVSDVHSSGHGTRIAGIIGAVGNNFQGVSGVGWGIRVMPIRATDQASGETTLSELLEGVNWAVTNGAKVVSVSYTQVENAGVEIAGRNARSSGVNLVWSAGNTNSNLNSLHAPSVTVVGGTTVNDLRWNLSSTVGSSFGRGVDIVAPCELIYSTRVNNGLGLYGYAPTGVSFAVPQVAAALALVADVAPTLNARERELRVLQRATDLGVPGKDADFGCGLLNVGAAVEWPSRKYRLTVMNSWFGTVSSNAYAITNAGQVWGYVDGGTTFNKVLCQWTNGSITGSISTIYVYNTGAGDRGPAIEIRDLAEGSTTRLVGQYSHQDGTKNGFSYDPTAAGWRGLAPHGFNQYCSTTGISTSGRMTLTEYGLGQADCRYQIYNNPSTSTLFSSPGWVGCINDFDEMAGSSGTLATHPFFASTPTNLIPMPGFTDAFEARRINNDGYFIGNRMDSSGSNRRAMVLYRDASDLRVDLDNTESEVLGFNSRQEAVGARINPSTGARTAWMFQGPYSGSLQAALTVPAPTVQLGRMHFINDRGQIVGDALVNGQTRGVQLDPVDSPKLGVNMGQHAALPTYIGSIPPLMSVEFADANGTPYPNAKVNLSYTGNTGIVNLVVPSTVTGSFRVYVRCNPSELPSYHGSGYLTKLYPPMSLPPAPREITYLPYSGSVLPQDNIGIDLVQGDCDSDNEIGPSDFGLIAAHFGEVRGADPTFDPRADIDGDGEIGPSDFGILSTNFGATGD